MTDTSSSSASSEQSGNRNRNRNRSRNRNRNGQRSGDSNRNRNRNSNRDRDSNRDSNRDDRDRRGAGSRSGGYTREKVPRRAPKPSLWKRFLALFGMGGDKPSAKTAPSKPESSPQRADQGSSRTSDRSRQRSTGKASERPAKKKRAARTPEKVEVTGPRLYVGNLSYDTTEEDLEELFSGVGGVESAEVVTHKQSQRSKGFAFVVLRSIDEAKRAVDVLHDKDFMGRKITVSGAKSTGPADRSSSSSET
jgi:hypothetical protein